MKEIYNGDWEEKQDLESDFNIKLSDNIEIIYAFYENESYSGSAFILFKENNKLYEVHGAHCSCYGLEDQWDPEETSIEYLEKSKDNRVIQALKIYKENIHA